MKKISLLILSAFFANVSFAQIDMATSLQTIGEGVTYTEYWNVEPGEGKSIISEKRYVATLKPVKNRFGKIVGFDAIDKEDNAKKRITYDYMYNSFDNYTHPSYMTAAANHAYAIINGAVFYLEHFENINSFEIDGIWVPSIPKDKASDPVFKGGKMSELKSVDLMKLVKDYFVAMKKIQDANPYNETAQAEADAMKFTKDSTQVMYNQVNADYWNSPEGQKKLGQMRKAKVTLVNDTGADLLICYGQGVSETLKPGAKKEFSCDNGKINRGKPRPNSTQHDDTGVMLLNLDGNNCGATINASTL